ncbi:hypothetical protein SAMN04488134_101161 [Amphibacillus marinus]|uniref:UPF0178 protein SAMN04488134_101161 n=1 Tax=Amphibacillus marinus TaxID=872970 RepID=A0A1H8GTN1_9BACI|nr:YaiI/YqxD family protein [Amphibacillus marinus]SEN47074.1 hypothetical protein SAMN04488134_101161 [Amphibacillus marinus]
MNIFVDADACPVTNEIIKIASERNLTIHLIKSYAHFSHHQYGPSVKEIYVDASNEAADYRLMSLAKSGDFVVTQDYGLASLALEQGCHVIHPKGFIYKKDNIDHLLLSRYQSAQIRKQGGRTKGPKPFSKSDRDHFIKNFIMLLSKT